VNGHVTTRSFNAVNYYLGPLKQGTEAPIFRGRIFRQPCRRCFIVGASFLEVLNKRFGNLLLKLVSFEQDRRGTTGTTESDGYQAARQTYWHLKTRAHLENRRTLSMRKHGMSQRPVGLNRVVISLSELYTTVRPSP